MDSAPQIIATAQAYAELHAALRARFEQLEISRAIVDEQAQLPAGYAGNLLGPLHTWEKQKRFGDSIFAIAAVAGCKLALVEDPDLMVLVGKLPRRNSKRAHTRKIKTAAGSQLTASEIGRLGGKKRAERLTPEQRSASARKAIRARWRRAAKVQRGPRRGTTTGPVKSSPKGTF